MLSLRDLIYRSTPPVPWDEGDNIPWDDPEFSKRMLAEHLTQDHDLASRRSEKIDAQVAWLRSLEPQTRGRVLDLACGPGLYLNRLAAAGYTGVGIDFSPASIELARREAEIADHAVEYQLDDLRTAQFGSGFDLALLLYGQLNVFQRAQAQTIIAKAHDALRPGGVFVVEPQTYSQVETTGHSATGWSSHESGLFSSSPHLLLTEAFWDSASSTATQRFYVVDGVTGEVARHALSSVAYTEDELTELLNSAGFGRVEHRPSLTGGEQDDGLCVVVAARTT
jgi:SAM-dependent methyltransferase